LSSCCEFSGPRYHGRVTNHFDGFEFHNQIESDHGPADLLRWLTHREHVGWPDWIEAEPGPRPAARSLDLRVTYINHATTLIQIEGLNILTDPIWSEHASPLPFAGPRRVRVPGIRFEDLPPIDLVLISHDHYDHMDIPTLQRLQREHRPIIVAGLGQAAVLRQFGIRPVRELDWGTSLRLRGLRVTGVPARHTCNRGLCDSRGTLWLGYVLQSRMAGNVYFPGDTGAGPHFEQIARAYGPLRLALLPISPIRPHWFMARVHLDAAEAVQAAHALTAQTSVPIHYGTFDLGDDGPDEPLLQLRESLAEDPARPFFKVLDFGEGYDVPPLSHASAQPAANPEKAP